MRTTVPAASRRAVLSAAGLAAAGMIAGPASAQRRFGEGAPPTRYPDPDIIALDPKRFRARLGNTAIQRLHTGMSWAEGPAWHATGRFLVWSDIPANEALRLTEEDMKVSRRFRFPAGFSNGNTFDREGRQIAFRHLTRDVVRYEPDGRITVLADRSPDGPFNAPNDGVVHPADGSVWFTDPGYGALMDYEGERVRASAQSPRPFQKEAVWRIDGQTGRVTKVTDAPFKPNGLCFSPDHRTLYVADTGRSHYDEARAIIWAFDVAEGGAVRNPRAFADMTMDGKAGFADGIRADEDGNIWSSAGWVGDGYDGVHVFAPNGDRIGLIRLPEICSNVCFGGTRRNRLFMTASQSLYTVMVETRGAHFC